MASFDSSGWSGAAVSAYLADPFGNATGSSVAGPLTPSSAGVASFSGLADSTGYVASDGSRVVRFRTPPASAGSGSVAAPVGLRTQPIVVKSDREIQNIANWSIGSVLIQPENIVRDEDSSYYLVCQTWDGTNRRAAFLKCTGDPRTDPWVPAGTLPLMSNNTNSAPFIFRDGGSWYCLTNAVTASAPLQLWKAASGPTSNWSQVAAALIPVGGAGTWDVSRTAEAHFIRRRDGSALILYMGFDTGNVHEQIGLATCPAGSSIETPGNWTKAAGNPVIPVGAAGSDDEQVVADPFVIEVGDTYWVCYFAHAADGVQNNTHSSMMLSTTTDFVTFTKRGVIWESPGLWPQDPSGRVNRLGPNWRGHWFVHESGDILWPYGASIGSAQSQKINARLMVIDRESFRSVPLRNRWVRVQSNATDGRVSLTGTGWTDWAQVYLNGGNAKITNVAGDRFKFKFDGTAIRIFGQAGIDSGTFNVWIDGVKVASEVDAYGTQTTGPWGVFLVNYEGLAAGYHTIELECTGNKNAASTGLYLKVDYAEYLPVVAA